ncbi:MAG: DNA-directed RNA polymerase subunit K [Candidatus Aenigmarchaeota archaeon]|nr:DNA-directed RNA polymerase subunit K [Candidatus Aenigmarchaeota archaeon]
MPNTKYRSRYEKTRILSARSLQISQGSPVLVKVPKGMTKPLDIARLEWEANVIPIDIKLRQAPEPKKK